MSLNKPPFLIVFCCLLMGACASTPHHHDSQRPSWIDTPPLNGRTAIGSAGYDIFGESKARQTAMSKAFAELAMQKGVAVDVDSVVISETVDRGNAGASNYASVTMNANIQGRDIAVTAQIKKYWKDTESKKIWILMVEE